MLFYLFAVPTILCIAPLMAPGRGTLAIISVIGAAFLGWAWVELWAQLSRPDFDGSFGGAVAFMAMILATLAFASGLFGRIIGLALQARGRTRAQVLWTDAAAVAAPILFLVVLQFF